MPKIEAKNIEEHVRIQTGRILDTASELFSSAGYRATDLGGIARRMGLARNSLYRYFPSKDHILVAVVEREMAPFAERTSRLAEQYPDPAERIDAWLELQVDLATGPCHAMIRMKCRTIYATRLARCTTRRAKRSTRPSPNY
jgi:AcrR family transcriptional regulator